MAVSSAAIHELADQVESMHGTRAIWALRLSDLEFDERATLIETHERVAAELRRRGHGRVRANVIHDPVEGEVLTLRIETGPAWRNAVSVP